MSLPPYAAPQQVVPPFLFTNDIIPAKVTTLFPPAVMNFDAARDLMLWTDANWQFAVGLDTESVPDNYINFGSPDPDQSSILRMPDADSGARLEVGQFRVAAHPYAKQMTALYAPNFPVWWMGRGGVFANNGGDASILKFEAKDSDLVDGWPNSDILVEAKNGLHMSAAATDGVVNMQFNLANLALQVLHNQVNLYGSLAISTRLNSSEKGIKLQKVADLPVAGGLLGEIRAVEEGGGAVYLCVCVDAGAQICLKTASFT